MKDYNARHCIFVFLKDIKHCGNVIILHPVRTKNTWRAPYCVITPCPSARVRQLAAPTGLGACRGAAAQTRGVTQPVAPGRPAWTLVRIRATVGTRVKYAPNHPSRPRAPPTLSCALRSYTIWPAAKNS